MKFIITKSTFWLLTLILLVITIICNTSISYAADTPPSVETIGSAINIFDTIATNFKQQAMDIELKIVPFAERLFFLLAGISMAWTAIELGLKHAEFGEIFGELLKYIVFTGIFFFLLKHGTEIAEAIFDTFAAMGGTAAGVNTSNIGLPKLSPSGIIDVGLDFYDRVMHSCNWDLDNLGIDLVKSILAIIFFIITLLIAIKLLIQIITLWCLMYGGCFFLGFGGCRWTKDITINYFKAVLNASTKYFALVFLVAIMLKLCQSLMIGFNSADPGTIIVFLSIPIIFFLLVETIPDVIAGIVSGNFSFSSGSAASAMVGVAAGSIATAATLTPQISTKIASGAASAANMINAASNSSVSGALSTAGAAIKSSSFGKGVASIAKAGTNIAKASTSVTSTVIKGASTIAGVAKEALSSPAQTAKNAPLAAIKQGANAVSSGVTASKNAINHGLNASKNAIENNIENPFKQGTQAVKNMNSTNKDK